MRQAVSDDYTLRDASSNPIVFENNNGHTLLLFVIDSHVIRVSHALSEDEKRTAHAHTVETTRTPFSVSYQQQPSSTNVVQLTTSALQVTVSLSPFCITWHKAPQSACATTDSDNDNEDWFAKDLAHRAYCYDKKHDNRWHYQQRRCSSSLDSDKGTFYAGLGEHTGKLNLSDRRFRLERMDAMGYDAATQDPLYKFHPFYLALTASNSAAANTTQHVYGIYYNNFGRTSLDFGQEHDAMWGDYVYYQVEKGPLDYFMIYGGSSVAKVVSTYSQMMGGYSLMPRSMFGYLASAMGYAEQDNAQEQLESFVQKCRQKYDLPCDGMHLSSGYTVNPGTDKMTTLATATQADSRDTNGSGGGERWVFTWNKKRFPSPARLAQVYHDAGMKIYANVKPWLLTNHPDYDKLASQHGLVWQPSNDGGQPAVIWQWQGGKNTKGKASYIDFTSEAGYQYWQEKMTSSLLKLGYDIWLDNNEFTTFDDETQTFQCQRTCTRYNATNISVPSSPSRTESGGYKVDTPVQNLLMIQASYEAVQAQRPQQRSCLITRSTVPFCQSLIAHTWSGDNFTSWKTLAYNIPMGTGANLCAIPAGYGHDIGGFSGPPPTPEQLVRWVQQGIFWTRFCIHSWNSDQSITEPWMYPEVFPVIRSSIQWRYRWIPHLYSLYVTLTINRNEPVHRPTFYDHPYDAYTLEQNFDFMVGPRLLVAPVCQQGQLERCVYLPLFYHQISINNLHDQQEVKISGGWYHYQTGQYYESRQWVTVPSLLKDSEAPLFIKEGSFMCYGKVMPSVHGAPDDERRIHIYPIHANSCADSNDGQQKPIRSVFKLIEDDGHSMAHQQEKAYADIELWMECYNDRVLVGIDILYDGYWPEYDTLWVTCPLVSEKRPLVFDGQEQTDVEMDDGHKYVKIKMKRQENNE